MKRVQKTFKIFAIGFIATLALAGMMLVRFSPMETLEENLYDARFKARGPLPTEDKVVIAAIDEKSLLRFGRFPWNRDRYVELLKKLIGNGAEIIIFDIIFSEPEQNDALFAAAIKDASNVILPLFFKFDDDMSSKGSESIVDSALSSVNNPGLFEKYPPYVARGVNAPVPELTKEAMGLGHINMFPDSDGTLRWENLVIAQNGYLYPSIALQGAASLLGVPKDKVVINVSEGVQLGGKRNIPTDKRGRILINYYGGDKTFKHISIADIMDGTAPVNLLRGKIVLVGATAVGLYDLRVTPFTPVLAGIEKHASVITSILDNRFLKKTPLIVDILILLSSGVVFSFLVIRFRAVGAAIVTGAFLAALSFAGGFLFIKYGVWMNLAYPAVNFVVIFMAITAYNYTMEERYSKKMRSMFSSYVTQRVVDELVKNPDMAKLGGARKEVSIIFSDVRGFTTFSERHSPEEVVAILNEYLGAMTEVIFRWEGTLDKFIGDAILAFWGAPMPQENHAELAVRCAMHMIKRLDELQAKWKAEGRPILEIGIGINTGEVIVGNIGAEGKKMDYTIIGDHVNLGSRIEGLTKKYQTRVLVTEFTLNKVRDAIKSGGIGHISVTGLENVVVKGKEVPVGIYSVEALSPEAESKIIDTGKKEAVVMKDK